MQIGAASVWQSSQVLYTCPGGGGTVCGPEPVESTWVKQITVPVGTVVRIQVTSSAYTGFGLSPSCWVADASGRLTYGKNDTGSCAVEVR